MSKIKELVKNEMDSHYFSAEMEDSEYYGPEATQASLERFAETIIKEAHKLVRSQADRWGSMRDDLMNGAVQEAADYMVAQFGIKND